MRARLGSAQKAAPDFGFLAAGARRYPMNAAARIPADLADVRGGKAASTRQRMNVVPWKYGDAARVKRDRRPSLELDQHLARADVVIADQRLRRREEGREMIRCELRQDAKVATELAVDDHAP